LGRQRVPQAPQLFTSARVSVQTPLQAVGAVDGQRQAPPLQWLPPVQAMPQPPQLASVVLSTQPPLQATVPVGQAWQIFLFLPAGAYRTFPFARAPGPKSAPACPGLPTRV